MDWPEVLDDDLLRRLADVSYRNLCGSYDGAIQDREGFPIQDLIAARAMHLATQAQGVD